MDDGKTGNLKFATAENTDKCYWIGRDAKLDYPTAFIGTMTPSTFRWTKMRHMYDIAQMAFEGKTEPIVKCGQDEYTAIEFLQAIGESRMWLFDFGMSHK
jgi:hypothetical protein